MSESAIRSIDTNILLRHFLQDHDDHSPRASALLLAVRRGEERIFCPPTVIFEAIHILHGRIHLPRPDIVWALENLIRLPGFILAEEAVVIDALEFWVQQSPLDFADCYHLALTKSLGMTQIYTFDKKMDRYPGVERIEP
ncbi:MAG TPA: PIN domain-containing protein [Thermomicrobiales bacterium]|nr:PIN domain-containing protein [Thermomicrobiales bacterium]